MLARALLVLAAALLAGCPRPAGQRGPAEPIPPPSIAVRPLAMVDLQTPLRGLVLGAGGPGRAAPVALVGRPHRRELVADGPQAGARRVIALEVTRLAPGTAGQAGAPPVAGRAPDDPLWTWRLAAARLVAASALAIHPAELRIDVSAPAGTPPPGAATLAVAVLAGLTGAALDPGATVLARLMPDGTLAPLVDAPAELDRALRRGARRIVLPIGGATARVAGTGRAIDLVRAAARGGAAAAQASDVAQAYRALTGASMPEPIPVPPEDMALSAAERTAIEAAYRRHLQRAGAAWSRLVEQVARAQLPPPLEALHRAAVPAIERAERLRARGRIAAAHALMARAAVLADAAGRIDRTMRLAEDGEAAAVGAVLAAPGPDAPAPSAAPPVGPPPAPQGIGEHLARLAGRLHEVAAEAWRAEADEGAPAARTSAEAMAAERPGMAALREARARLAEASAPAALAAAHAAAEAARAEDLRGLARPVGPPFVPDREALAALARAQAEAAAAGVALLAAVPGPRLPEAIVAARAADLASGGADDPTGERTLAAAWLARERAAQLLARAEEAERDRWTGEPTRAPRREQLTRALAVAERAARQHAAAARVAVGHIPAAARLPHQAARVLAAGRAAERLLALELYRASSAASQRAVLVALSATARPADPARSRPPLRPAPGSPARPAPPSPSPPPPSPSPPSSSSAPPSR